MGFRMKMKWAEADYWTERFDNRTDGFEGFRLHRNIFGKVSIAAEVIYWDATGGFTVKTIDGDVPVEMIQAAIEEATREIKTR